MGRANRANSALSDRGPLRRGGSIYLLALGVSTLVTVIGLTALITIRAHQRIARQTTDRAAAQSLALSAIHHALTAIDLDPQWRTTYTSGLETATYVLGNGTFSWRLIDDLDGDLANDQSQLVRLQGIGRLGQAEQLYGVRLQPVKTPLSCLEAALHGNGSITFSGAVISADAAISTNASMNASNAAVNAPVQAVGSITGATYTGTKNSGAAARDLPDPIRVLDPYLLNGTEIPLAALPFDNQGSHVLERIALGAGHNPLGVRNPEGIYVIRCGGAPIIIRDCRIAATIVLLDPGTGSRIEGSVNWEPPAPTLPALLVRGSIDVGTSSNSLSESSGGSNVNYNPPGLPFEGSEDLDTSDSYPSLLKGLMYVSERLTNARDELKLEGVIVVGQATNLSGTVSVRYRRAIRRDPPPGFYAMTRVVVVPKTWQQDVR